MARVSDAPAEAASPRERVLRAALRLIGTEGLGAVSHRQVARDAEVSLGTLTYHFRDRDELLRESLRLLVGEEVARLEAIGAGLRTGELGLADLDQLVGTAMAGVVDVSLTVAQFELYLHATRDPRLRDAVAECRAAYDGLAREALVLLGVPDPDEVAPLVVSTVDGLALRRLVTGEDVTAATTRALLLLAAGARALAG
ncbi:putativetranscriptional regulator [Patulibacter medicamentivorans]|uniref:Putativetranscriptional regulator n=1 Tax=Patulibacter medicamentivorans TaxID=1097667 RepID=H0E7L1_9ACTN|nr:putativetranscriptional regulator [Patulibacter medicamentivorans]